MTINLLLLQEPFLERIVKDQEKWIIYVNVRTNGAGNTDECAMVVSEEDLHPMNVLLKVW